ncbi:MAG: glycosyltransferase family 4 protein [Actinomycetota bacterium]|nr:glycosyltransferase family 4 protein [Actinomycetota bacterium]
MTGLPGPADVVAAARVTDLMAAAALVDLPLPPPRRPPALASKAATWHLTYLLSRVEVGGGAGVLLEQANELARSGAKVTVISRFPSPSWFPLALDYVQVPFGEPMCDAVPPCDLIVAGHWEFVLPARQLALAPVVYLEQGEFHLYDPVSEPLQALVRASVTGAHGVFALGGAARRALSDRFGVRARQLAPAVDATFFQPPRPRAGGATLLLLGWDGPRTWALEDARAIIAAIGESHPEVHPVLITSISPGVDVGGEVVVAPTREELIQRYRDATVCVSCSRDAASPLAPLKAMAVGTPVVTTATDAALSWCRHGKDVLMAPIGDIDALITAVRRLLDDPTLAVRLALEASRTAQRHAWTVQAPQVLQHYQETAEEALVLEADHPPPPMELDLEGIALEEPSHEALLRCRLPSCPAEALAIPVSQPALDGYRVVRWKVVARRGPWRGGVARAYFPARSDRPVEDAPYQPALEQLRLGRGEEALASLTGLLERSPRAEHAVLGRWVVLALLAASRPADAFEVAAAFARDFPSHPDYLYLAVLASLAARRPVDIAGPLEAISLLGRGARFEEWFDDPARMLRDALVAR